MAPRRFSAENLKRLAEANNALEASLTAQGVEFRPELVFRMTVTVLKDMLLGEDPEAQLEFDVRYQEVFATTLEDAEAQLARAKLTSNGAPKPRLLRPGQG